MTDPLHPDIIGPNIYGKIVYLPKRFENENFDESYDLIQKNSLANLISTTEHGPFVSHIPLVLEKMMCQPGTVL